MDLIASNSPVNAGKDQNALVSLDFFSCCSLWACNAGTSACLALPIFCVSPPWSVASTELAYYNWEGKG